MHIQGKIILTGSVVLAAVSATGCGMGHRNSATPSDIATSSDVAAEDGAQAETVSEDDPKIQAYENMTVPEKPALESMGSITLPDFASTTVERVAPAEVTDDDVNNYIESVLEENIVAKDGAAAEGDTVNITYKGTIDGKEFDGGSEDGAEVVLGSDTFIDGFEDELVGMKAGETKDISIQFPDTYQNSTVAGKTAVFKTTMNEVKTKPELTDSFVQSLNTTDTTTVDEYKAEVKEQLQKRAEQNAEDDTRSAVLEKLVDASEITPSEAMLDYEKKDAIHNVITNAQNYGMSLADVLNQSKASIAEFDSDMVTTAEENAKYEMVIAKILSDDNITATDQVIADYIEDYNKANMASETKEEIVKNYGEDLLKERALNVAAVKAAEEKITLTDPKSAD